MCRLFHFHNTISLIGAWFILISTLGLFYLVYSFIEWRYKCKYSYNDGYFRTLKESLHSLEPSTWWHC